MYPSLGKYSSLEHARVWYCLQISLFEEGSSYCCVMSDLYRAELEAAREREESLKEVLRQYGWVILPYGRIVYDPDAAHEELIF